mgnify:CR=1 FL=1
MRHGACVRNRRRGRRTSAGAVVLAWVLAALLAVAGCGAPDEPAESHEPASDAPAHRMAGPEASGAAPAYPGAMTADRQGRPAAGSATPARLAEGKSAQTAPGEAPYPSGALTAACERSAASLRRQLPAGFHVVVAPPFVVAGNEPATRVRARARHTVVGAAEALWASLFDARPSRPIRVLLPSGEASYRGLAVKLFGDKDLPHFGYYRRRDRTLVMNIATGGGTLVHELTHALMEPDFPEAPTWFDEGLASLHEQCSIGEDRIVGRVNWRLPALRAALDARRLRSLRKLITKRDFRTNNEGLNYAHARYFVFYMQKRGLLGAFYRRFRDTHRPGRPTDVACVERTFGQGLDEIDRAFRAWLRTLRYRRGGQALLENAGAARAREIRSVSKDAEAGESR